MRTFVRTTLLVADFIPATKAGGGGVGGSGLWNCLSGTWTLGQLSKCHLDTRTAVRVALGHSDNCPSGTQTLGQLSELHLDTRTAVRVTLKHLYSRPKYFGQGPKWFARACASRWLDNSKRRDVKRTEASLHGLLFRQVHKPIPSRRRALTAVVRGLVRAESGLGSGLGSAGRPAPTHHPLRLTPVTSSLTVRGVQMASSALVPSTNDDPAWPKPAAFSPPTKDAPNKKLITQTMTDVLVQQKLDHLSKGKDCWQKTDASVRSLVRDVAMTHDCTSHALKEIVARQLDTAITRADKELRKRIMQIGESNDLVKNQRILVRGCFHTCQVPG